MSESEQEPTADGHWSAYGVNWHPDWTVVMRGCGDALPRDNDLLSVTRGTLRLAAHALGEECKRDYYHNYAAAHRECLSQIDGEPPLDPMRMRIKDCRLAVAITDALASIIKVRQAIDGGVLTFKLVAFDGDEDGGTHVEKALLPASFAPAALDPLEAKLRAMLDGLGVAADV